METFLGNLPPDTQLPEGVMEYCQLRANCFRSYNLEFDILSGIQAASRDIRARTPAQVWASANAGNADDCVELGLRMYTGCGAKKDVEGAFDWLSRVAYPSHPKRPANVPRLARARAFSTLTCTYLDRAKADSDCWQIDDLYRGAFCADAAAALGLITPSVLVIGRDVERVGLRRQEDCHFPNTDTTRFAQLSSLWEVCDRRAKEVELAQKKHGSKVVRAPNAYRCAADECGIEATSKSGLMKCSGKCQGTSKVSYCSKECQRRDWKRHKAVCKPGANGGLTPKADAVATTTLPDELGSEHFNTDGKERSMDWAAPNLPGGKLKVSSTTMSPAFMKEIRDEIDGKLAARGEKSGKH